MPHCPAVMVPQVAGVQHVLVAVSQTDPLPQPQLMVPPQVSETAPHVPAGSSAHVFGEQQLFDAG
jgi:hypothetical protein